jgi:hypothetical protein
MFKALQKTSNPSTPSSIHFARSAPNGVGIHLCKFLNQFLASKSPARDQKGFILGKATGTQLRESVAKMRFEFRDVARTERLGVRQFASPGLDGFVQIERSFHTRSDQRVAAITRPITRSCAMVCSG